jgi:hypothetical protein
LILVRPSILPIESLASGRDEARYARGWAMPNLLLSDRPKGLSRTSQSAEVQHAEAISGEAADGALAWLLLDLLRGSWRGDRPKGMPRFAAPWLQTFTSKEDGGPAQPQPGVVGPVGFFRRWPGLCRIVAPSVGLSPSAREGLLTETNRSVFYHATRRSSGRGYASPVGRQGHGLIRLEDRWTGSRRVPSSGNRVLTG